MKKVICFVIAMLLLSTQVFAATQYDVTVEGLTYSEKEELIEWLDDENLEYDIESYSSNTSSSNTKKIEVKKLSSSEKSNLISWLKNRGYDYSTKTKNSYYYVTIEYNSNTKSALINYLDNKDYDYDSSTNLNSSNRSGQAYLVANGYLWYADGDEIEKVDEIYSAEYVLFTKNGGISYINKSKQGIFIEDVDDPKDSEKIATSVKSITKNSSGYAVSFKSSSKTTKIEIDDDVDNEKVIVYFVKNNTLYSLSSKNKSTKIKSLKSISNSSYSQKNSNIGFSEWGDLVCIDSSGIVWFNEKIDKPNKIETLKDQNGYTVKAKYFTVSSGIIKTVVLSDGSIVTLEDD